jgi:quercetin dioxygenase-like cupin family protein
MADDDVQDEQYDEEPGPPAIEVWNDYDPSMRFIAVFPVRPELGAAGSSVVYYVIEPGRHTGLHAENAEEVLYVFDGEGEAFVTGRQVLLKAGDFQVFPAGTAHDVYAYGETELRFLSFYPVALMQAEFQQELMPMGGNLLTSNPFAPVIEELNLEDLPPDFPIDLLGGAPAAGPDDEE